MSVIRTFRVPFCVPPIVPPTTQGRGSVLHAAPQPAHRRAEPRSGQYNAKGQGQVGVPVTCPGAASNNYDNSKPYKERAGNVSGPGISCVGIVQHNGRFRVHQQVDRLESKKGKLSGAL